MTTLTLIPLSASSDDQNTASAAAAAGNVGCQRQAAPQSTHMPSPDTVTERACVELADLSAMI